VPTMGGLKSGPAPPETDGSGARCSGAVAGIQERGDDSLGIVSLQPIVAFELATISTRAPDDLIGALGQAPEAVSPVLYDQICAAIEACVAVDGAKDIRDKAAALAIYYRQAANVEAEREVAKVRLRAERRVGELPRQLERAPASKGGDVGSASARAEPTAPSSYARALEDNSIKTQQASPFQQLADLANDDFEYAVDDPMVPLNATSIIRGLL
jgi:hypothetical protein